MLTPSSLVGVDVRVLAIGRKAPRARGLLGRDLVTCDLGPDVVEELIDGEAGHRGSGVQVRDAGHRVVEDGVVELGELGCALDEPRLEVGIALEEVVDLRLGGHGHDRLPSRRWSRGRTGAARQRHPCSSRRDCHTRCSRGLFLTEVKSRQNESEFARSNRTSPSDPHTTVSTPKPSGPIQPGCAANETGSAHSA